MNKRIVNFRKAFLTLTPEERVNESHRAKSIADGICYFSVIIDGIEYYSHTRMELLRLLRKKGKKPYRQNILMHLKGNLKSVCGGLIIKTRYD